MKTHTADSLARKALAYGGRLDMGGAVVNAARAQIASRPVVRAPIPAPAPQPAVAPAPEPTPAYASAQMDALAAHAINLGESNARVLEAIQRLIDKPAPVAPQIAAPPKRNWTFKVEYVAGRLDSIKATQE